MGSDSIGAIQESIAWLRDHPLAMLIVLALPFGLLAWMCRIYPAIRMVPLLSIPAIVSVFASGQETMMFSVIVLDGIIVVVCLADSLTLPRRKRFSVDRQLLRIASIQKNHPVTLILVNASRRNFGARIKDDLPQHFDASPKEFEMRLTGKSRTILRYDFQARQRGAYAMEFVHLQIQSGLGLWTKNLKIPCESSIHVYPDMKQLGEYAILARTNRLSLMGVKRTRRIGQDNEFERLRDYTQDDNYRHLDWRATARRNKLIVRDFQTNQSQRIIFMLDCGRMMTNEAAGLTLLDHSLNAMLMMSYVALRQGDSVGLICFSDKVHNFVPPKGGMKHMNHLIHAVFDRKPELVESRYDQAFLYLATHCHKRSLVVMISNVIDDVNSHQIEQYLGSLVGRHLPLGVLLRDRRIFDAVEKPAQNIRQIYQAGAAADILSWRHQVLIDMEHKGVLSLDVFPEDMTAPLVNQYLEIKARHLL